MWAGAVGAAVVVALVLLGIAFGTSALLFPVLIVGAIAVVVGVAYALGAVGRREGPAPDPVNDAAPAAGEGGAGQSRAGGPDPSGVR